LTETKKATDLTPSKTERRLPALAVSRGIGIGRISFFHEERRRFYRLNLSRGQIDNELARFRAALAKSILQLRELSINNDNASEKAASDIFGVHLLMLESSIVKKIEMVIAARRVNAEWAIRTVLDEYLEKQNSVPNAQFRDKYLDIEDITDRLMRSLGTARVDTHENFDAVIVARELTPSMVMDLAKSKPSAIITEQGGWTSHSAILAREFGLPMVSGVRDLEHLAALDDKVIVDGISGEVILNPSETTIAEFSSLFSQNGNGAMIDGGNAHGTATLDGTSILIRANVDQPEAYSAAREKGAEGVGLFRSESLLRRPREVPGEHEQAAAYRRIADAACEHGVNIRTFDIGIERLGIGSGSVERNPSLGLRSIRLSLAHPAQFRIQIRALLRASLERKLDILLPMVSGLSEVLRAKEIIEEERIKLTKEAIGFGTPKIGAMIETPSAVLTVNEIAKNVDFLCVGTNDLVQYLLAVDRDNDAVAEWYQTLHPAVIRAVGEVIAAAQGADIPVTVCGEMAGSPFYVPVLLGLGARDLSMNVNSIQPVRQLIAGISISDTITLVKQISMLGTADEIENCLREYYLENWSSLFMSGLLSVRHR
jgi:phosphotransferase system enzyme I (PtsI)